MKIKELYLLTQERVEIVENLERLKSNNCLINNTSEMPIPAPINVAFCMHFGANAVVNNRRLAWTILVYTIEILEERLTFIDSTLKDAEDKLNEHTR